ELALLERPPAAEPEELPAEQLGDLGAVGGGRRPGYGESPGRDRQRTLRRPAQLGGQRADADTERKPAAAELDSAQSGEPREQRRRPRQHGTCARRPGARPPGRQGRQATAAQPEPA